MMKKNKEKEGNKESKVNMHKVLTPASKITGGGDGPYPETWNTQRPENTTKYG